MKSASDCIFVQTGQAFEEIATTYFVAWGCKSAINNILATIGNGFLIFLQRGQPFGLWVGIACEVGYCSLKYF